MSTTGKVTAAGGTVGALLLLGGLAASALSFVAVLFLANACGPMSDSCEEHGQSADGFEVAVVCLLVSLVVSAAGLIAVVVAATTGLGRSLGRSLRRPQVRR